MKRFNPLKSNTPQPLTGAKVAPPPVPGTFGVTLNPNPEGTGLELRFPKRPSDEILDAIKAAGWRWSRFRMCWYHRNTPENH